MTSKSAPVQGRVREEQLRGQRLPEARLAAGDTVIWTENDSSGSKITA